MFREGYKVNELKTYADWLAWQKEVIREEAMDTEEDADNFKQIDTDSAENI